MSASSGPRSHEGYITRLLNQLGVKVQHPVADSRKLKPGDTFLACVGEHHDARNNIPQAIALGANAILWEKQGFSWKPEWKIPNAGITGLRHKAGEIASAAYGHPSRNLWLVGITGTNGKTTCSHWYAQAMAILGKKTAIIGTLGHGFPGALHHSEHTTPDAVYLQQLMAEYLDQGASSLVMEASSHGLSQGRLTGSEFAVAVLTNLTRDHLDYHGSMDAYAAAKARLFFWEGLQYAVLNLDEVLGVELSQQLAGKNVSVIGYSFRQPRQAIQTSGSQKILYGSNLRFTTQHIGFDVEFCDRHANLQCNVTGRYNAYNLLTVLATLLASNIDFDEAVAALQQVQPIPGRMEQLGGGDQPTIIVDYAHTPDALNEVLAGLREILTGTHIKKPTRKNRARLICVIGCGGDRDRGKRPMIGEIAAHLSDEVIITSDNPRTENPVDIINEVMAGATGKHCTAEVDRTAAIYRAIHGARKGDIVLIAGKGAETYQEIQGKKYPFDDREVVRQVLHDLAGPELQVQG
ncbi:UDP-N-acetylmuramoyl-L-alanyl-D-glutamate--2,6-diaminopimelate ligase [Nitrosomonas sp.]|uniref:UDP-N-acetylmuramoyl-L-alanyl-D-glutamate--2, 6-diaminopimelate ligase n=1 Tax=Nitrosomonas sp. TaxID=42353 RepID=UPI0025DFDA76|nr:UDP-N-acetylmuramoyl-L-alanyl-D-glutamate--2,6-diaminopimelate ligase [Nitrosomonas sp.]MCC6915999.1 UDP-N-acetylmuramoyl-L-alanyl-D-glutamate--2,6-diaminopimelate ligase [Nitrosomonas sp.]